MLVHITKAEARTVAQVFGGILAASAYDLGQLKMDGYDARTVRAMERLIDKLLPLSGVGTTEAVK